MRLFKLIRKLSPLALILALVMLFQPALQPADSAPTARIEGFGTATALPGAPWQRLAVPWDQVEPAAGLFRWEVASDGSIRNVDQWVDQASSAGSEVMLVLQGGPVYLPQTADQPIAPPALLASWQTYVEAAVNRYGDRVHTWQIGNQINNRAAWGAVLYPLHPTPLAEPDPILYAQMLQSAARIIRAHNPADRVVLGSLNSSSSADCAASPFVFLSQLYSAGAWNSFDAVAYEPDWGAAAPETLLERGPQHDEATGICLVDTTARYNLSGEMNALTALVNQLGAKPVWVTRLGWNADRLTDMAAARAATPDRMQGDLLVRAAVPLLAESGAARVFWDAAPPGPAAQQTRANLTALLTGARPLGTFQRPPTPETGIYEYRFRKDGQLILMVWRGPQGTTQGPVEISGLNLDSLRGYAADTPDFSSQNGLELTVNEGRLIFNLGSQPVIFIGRSEGRLAAAWQTASDDLNGWLQNQTRSARAQFWGQVQTGKQSALDWLKVQLRDWLDDLLNKI